MIPHRTAPVAMGRPPSGTIATPNQHDAHSLNECDCGGACLRVPVYADCAGLTRWAGVRRAGP